MTQAARSISYGLIAAFTLLLICILIRPAGLSANDGLSYFGSFKNTIIPYSAAFFLNAYFYWEAARVLVNNNKLHNYVAYGLRVMALLLTGLVLTPHTLVNPIHTAIGTTLFVFQLVLSIWLLVKIDFSWQNLGLVCIELCGGLISFYYLPKPHGLLLQGQVIFQLAFGILLCKVVNKYGRQQLTDTK